MSLLDEAALRALIREEMRAVLAEARVVPEGGLLTLDQAAREFSTTPSTLRRWMAQGRLKRVGDGRNTRVRRSDVVEAFAVRKDVADDWDASVARAVKEAG